MLHKKDIDQMLLGLEQEYLKQRDEIIDELIHELRLKHEHEVKDRLTAKLFKLETTTKLFTATELKYRELISIF